MMRLLPAPNRTSPLLPNSQSSPPSKAFLQAHHRPGAMVQLEAKLGNGDPRCQAIKESDSQQCSRWAGGWWGLHVGPAGAQCAWRGHALAPLLTGALAAACCPPTPRRPRRKASEGSTFCFQHGGGHQKGSKGKKK